jgi:hypothetical protein
MGAMWDNPKSVESAIKRLTSEIEEIDRFFYSPSGNDDRVAYAGMLERKRDDVVRSIVLQLHTSIEDLLNSYITFSITGTTRHNRQSGRSQSARALRQMLYGGGSLGFEMKLNLALGLRIISGKTKERLVALNTLRNKSSHNWLLKVPVRYGKRLAQKSDRCFSMKAAISTASPPSKTLSTSTPLFT